MNELQPAIDTMRGWSVEFIRILPHIAVAIIAILFFFILARILRRLMQAPLERIFIKSHSAQTLVKISSYLVYYLCITIGVLIAASVLGLDKVFTSMLASVGVVGLVGGYAFKDVAANFFAGAVISLRRPFKKDELIKVGDYFGYVIGTDLLYTTIRTTSGQVIYVANQAIFEGSIVNFSESGSRRIVLSTGVSYGDDLEKVRQIALEAIKKLTFLKADKPIDLFFTDIGGSSYNFVLRYWIEFENQPQFRHAQSEGIVSIKKAFEANGISIPYPVQTLDFGVKGGVNLSESLEVLNEKQVAQRPDELQQ
jgi:small conductance mechanosensitive channel